MEIVFVGSLDFACCDSLIFVKFRRMCNAKFSMAYIKKKLLNESSMILEIDFFLFC